MDSWEEPPDASVPGWYPDPDDAGMLRYWDGEWWTDTTTPAPRGGSLTDAFGPTTRPTNGMAIASLACGVGSFVTCGLGAILGIVFGHLARRQLRASGGDETGAGLALAGLIVSYIVVALVLLGLAVVVAASASTGA